ncbi:MAG: VWA domain-containing protein [Clostridiales bacterium]|nr:VWA domain-containing protein [Clostridiales bacterium]
MSFTETYEQFLYKLRDDYSFLIPVDRVRDCLVCADNITDVEEVCFRTQALVCKNEEQVRTFQSLFGQTFLDMTVLPPKSSTSPEDELKQLISSSMKLQEQIAENESMIQKEEERLEENRKNLEEQQKRLGEEIEANQNSMKAEAGYELELDSAKAAALPNVENEKLKPTLDKLRKHPLAGSKEFDKICSKIMESLQSSDYKKELDKCADMAMKAASKMRNSGKDKEFSQYLKLVTTIKEIQKTAQQTVGKAEKKALSESKKRASEANRRRKEAEKEIAELQSNIMNMERETRNAQRRITRKTNDIMRCQTQYEEKQRETERLNVSPSIIQKASSSSHRAIFIGGINAVQTTSEIEKLMETNLRSMNASDKQKILSYIRTNAKVFRQTLRRKASSPQHRRIDVKGTVKAASKTNGEPFIIKYQKPKKSHAKVMILTDISGSCRSASTLALYFMAMMDEAFPGGCKKFAFVNNLNPVDRYFRDRSADDGVKTVLNTIPTRGVYSDYGKTIEEFREQYCGSFHKDTTVIILGDARNNKNDSHAEDLKWIADRVHKIYWLNTDDKNKWNQGDSVIAKYEDAGAQVFHMQKTGDLLKFLANL